MAALSESAGRWAVASRRALASEAIVRPSGSRPLSDDGRDLATCSSLENVHLRYLRYLRAISDVWICDAFVSLCLCVCDALCALCASVSLWLFGRMGGLGGLGVLVVNVCVVVLAPR